MKRVSTIILSLVMFLCSWAVFYSHAEAAIQVHEVTNLDFTDEGGHNAYWTYDYTVPSGSEITKVEYRTAYGYDDYYTYSYVQVFKQNGTGRYLWKTYNNYHIKEEILDLAGQGYVRIKLFFDMYDAHGSAYGSGYRSYIKIYYKTGPATPGKPQLIYDNKVSYWQQRIRWNANGNPPGAVYELWRKTLDANGRITENKVIYKGTATEFVTKDQGPGKYYLYRVRAGFQGNWSKFSPETSYWTVNKPSVRAQSGKLIVSWPKTKDGVTYRIWYREKDRNWKVAGTTKALSYTIANLNPALQYQVALSPVLTEGTGWWHGASGLRAPLAYTPGTPACQATSSTSLKVSWPTGGNPAGVVYELWRKSSTQDWRRIYAGTAASFNDSGLAPNTSYTYKVRAKNIEGVFTAFSRPATGLTAPPKPAAPSGSFGPLNWSNTAGRGWVTLSWKPVPGATGYKVWVFDGRAYRSFDAGNVTAWDSRSAKIYPSESALKSYRNNSASSDLFNHNRGGLDLRDTPNGLYKKTAGTRYDNHHNYWFRVSAYNKSGDSGYSNGAYMPTLPNRTDKTAPTGRIVINDDQMIAGSPTVVLNLSATDPLRPNYTRQTDDDASGVAYMRFSNDKSKWSNWVKYADSYRWKLDTSTFGKKIVYVQFKDRAGNISNAFSDDINYYLVDAQAPKVSLKINNGASTAYSRDATLDIHAEDDLSMATLLTMRFSNDFKSWSEWEPYKPHKPYKLSNAGTVHVQVRDASGNIGTAHAKIALNTSGGETVLTNNKVVTTSGSKEVTLKLNAVDTPVKFVNGSQVQLNFNLPSGISQVQYSLDNVRWLPPEPASRTKTIQLPDWEGHKAVYVRLPDGTVYVQRFVLDRTPPTFEASWLGRATVAKNGRATIVVTAVHDNLCPADKLEYSLDGRNWYPLVRQIPVRLSGTGYEQVTLYTRDLAGNVASKSLGIFAIQ